MLKITYPFLLGLITLIWVLVRCRFWKQQMGIDRNREMQLLLVYICIVVVARFTFFPFSKVHGAIQPLVLDWAKMLPPRINLLPVVYLFDYPEKREAWLNFIGNTAMFMPLGAVWPYCFRQLDSHKKVLLSGVATSAAIEILQLPFFDRVSDIDDLLLNSLGFTAGYGLYLLLRKKR